MIIKFSFQSAHEAAIWHCRFHSKLFMEASEEQIKGQEMKRLIPFYRYVETHKKSKDPISKCVEQCMDQARVQVLKSQGNLQ